MTEALSLRNLTLKLRALERDGFVWRSATGDVLPKVGYGLTVQGHALVGELRRLIDWLSRQRSNILAARNAFDRKD